MLVKQNQLLHQARFVFCFFVFTTRTDAATAAVASVPRELGLQSDQLIHDVADPKDACTS